MSLDSGAAERAMKKISDTLGLDPGDGLGRASGGGREHGERGPRTRRRARQRPAEVFCFSPSVAPARCTPTGSPGPSAFPASVAPLGAGTASAFGFLCAPLSFDLARALYGRLDGLDWDAANAALEEMEDEGRELLQASGVAEEDVMVRRLGELRYTGQGHEVGVKLPDGTLDPEDVEKISDGYREEYRRLYGREGPDVPLEAITWRVEVSAPRPEILQGEERGDPRSHDEARKGERGMYLPESDGFAPVPVYDRYKLTPARPSTARPSGGAGVHGDRGPRLPPRWTGRGT